MSRGREAVRLKHGGAVCAEPALQGTEASSSQVAQSGAREKRGDPEAACAGWVPEGTLHL